MSQAEIGDDPRATQPRRCASCSQPAVRCIHVTQHVYGGIIPSGRTYQHRCEGCGAEFETLSPFRLVRNGFFAALTPPIGLLLLLFAIDGAWYYWLIGGVMVLFGLWWIYATGKAFVAQLRNPAA